VGFTKEDSRVALAFYNGIQNQQITGLVSASGSTVKGATISTLSSPASDSNNAKDFQVYLGQFIGEDGIQVNAIYYNGYNAAVGSTGLPAKGGTGDVTGQQYYAAGVFATVPVTKKLDVKAGTAIGQTNAGIFPYVGKANPASGGFFGEVDYEMDDITPLVVRYDYTATDLSKPYADTMKVTFGALTPFVENVYMNPTYSLTMTDAAAGYTYAHQLSDSLFVFF
jgi:hypothetical protein